jgi:hypothetical protein
VTFVRPQVSAVLVSAIVLSVSVLTHLIADARLSVLTELVTAAGSGAVVAVYSRFWRLAAHPPPPAIMQRLPTLQAVVAVGQTQQLAGLEVALLSIDVYDDGFVANTVVRSTLQEPDEIGVAYAELPLEASDDRGGHYVGRVGGSGSSDGWRGQYRFTPALDPAARELRLEAAECHWTRFHRLAGLSPAV